MLFVVLLILLCVFVVCCVYSVLVYVVLFVCFSWVYVCCVCVLLFGVLCLDVFVFFCNDGVFDVDVAFACCFSVLLVNLMIILILLCNVALI